MAYLLFVVNDEPMGLPVIEFVANFFAQRGHQAEVLTDGAQAWERMQQVCPDVLVSDIALPHRDGLELMGELKRRQPGRAGVILLGLVAAEVGWQLSLGEAFFREVDALIIKPYSGDLGNLPSSGLVNYHEQLIISVGHQLYRLGLYQTAA